MGHEHAHLGHHVPTMRPDVWVHPLAQDAARGGFSQCIDLMCDVSEQMGLLSRAMFAHVRREHEKGKINAEQARTYCAMLRAQVTAGYDAVVQGSCEAKVPMCDYLDVLASVGQQQQALVSFGIDRTNMVHGFGCHYLARALIMSRMEDDGAFATVPVNLAGLAVRLIERLNGLGVNASCGLVPQKAAYMYPLVKVHKQLQWRWIQASRATIGEYVDGIVYLALTAVREATKCWCELRTDRLLAVEGVGIKLWFLEATLGDVVVNLPSHVSHMGKGQRGTFAKCMRR